MSGETDLDRLLAGMNPEMADGTYVFATVARGAVPAGARPLMSFEEAEGTTLILLREEAERIAIGWEFPCRMITLRVHSSLEAAGFIARVATALAEAGIGVNPVAAFHHDHLFVPEDRALDAIRILRGLAARGGRRE